MNYTGNGTTVRVNIIGLDGVSLNAAVTLEHVAPRLVSYWVATARIVIGNKELVCSTAGQETAESALGVVARWLYAICIGVSEQERRTIRSA